MTISIITPFYEGEEYMAQYMKCMLANYEHVKALGDKLEVILVNDSPWKKLEVPSNSSTSQFVQVITNEKNMGIHGSRLAGLEKAQGEYILFLDQDDLICEDAIATYLKQIVKHPSVDVFVANAALEQSDGSCVNWYRTDYHKSLIGDMATYTKVGIQIISPGHTLIKKSAIPAYWGKHVMSKNGADDYYLWLLMIANKAQFKYVDKVIYTHKYTAKNLSADTNVTDDSAYEFMEYLGECDYFNQKDLYTLHEMITFKNQFRASNKVGKVMCALANFSLFMTNLSFKKKTKTGYGFNR